MTRAEQQKMWEVRVPNIGLAERVLENDPHLTT